MATGVGEGKATWAGKWTRIEDVVPIRNGDIPASYVSLPEGIFAAKVGSNC